MGKGKSRCIQSVSMKQDYRIVYSDRKTLSIIVERDRSLLVRAPRGMSAEEIQKRVDEKKLWIYEKICHPQKYPPEPLKKEFVTGETVLYLGRNYRLEVTDQDIDTVLLILVSTFHARRKQRQASYFNPGTWREHRKNCHPEFINSLKQWGLPTTAC